MSSRRGEGAEHTSVRLAVQTVMHPRTITQTYDEYKMMIARDGVYAEGKSNQGQRQDRKR